MKTLSSLHLILFLLLSPATATPPEIVPTDGVTPVAQYFREARLLSEFGKNVSDAGAGSHWGESECTCDKGFKIEFETSEEMAAYLAKVRERIRNLVKEADGAFSVVSSSGAKETPSRFIARYTIKGRTGFLRMLRRNRDPKNEQKTNIIEFQLYEIPVGK